MPRIDRAAAARVMRARRERSAAYPLRRGNVWQYKIQRESEKPACMLIHVNSISLECCALLL
jgi:hypothetical protein